MNKALPCELIDWLRFYELAREVARQIRDAGIDIDTIVAIGRGGYMPARLLSDMLDIFDLTGFKIEHYKGSQKSRRAVVKYPLAAPVSEKHILLVDDVSDTGDTFNAAIKHVQSLGNPANIHTAVLHHKLVSRFVPDFYAEKVEQWRWIIYPWALNEDLSNLISAMQPRSDSPEHIAQYLFENHGIHATAQQIRDALLLLNT